MYSCGWFVRFTGVEWKKYTNSHSVVITTVCRAHYNNYDPSYADQFVLARIRSSKYKKCAHQCLKEVMVQIAIEPFAPIRAIRELLSKVISERKYIDKDMINHVGCF